MFTKEKSLTTRASLAALVAISAALAALPAEARSKHARSPQYDAFNADTSISAPPSVASPVVGHWRYNMLRHGCDSTYPMMEGNCGTATGGPVGGMGS